MTSPASPNPFGIQTLGEPTYPSPLDTVHWTSDSVVLLNQPLFDITENPDFLVPRPLLYLERAGPRKKVYVEPGKVVAGIVCCGGLCPGINNVVRAIVQCLWYRYHVREILGFRYGYEGLNPAVGLPPTPLNPSAVRDIHNFGGCFLGTSRGPQSPSGMVDYMTTLGVNILFCIGGDGTQKGAHAIAEEVTRRGVKISVIGIPKTIDNDIAYADKTFGFETAVEMAQDPIKAAHEEARAARNGIAIVKLMGRDSGFIALSAALASSDVNILLIPEVPFTFSKLCSVIETRLPHTDHCVIVVSEGAGQDVIAASLAAKGDVTAQQKDKSGNVKFRDIGRWLSEEISGYFKGKGTEVTVKYIDPSYTIRSAPANAMDAVFTVRLAHAAVHAGMSGKTDLVIGQVHNTFVHIPIPKAVEARKKIDVTSTLYQVLLDNTGMPADMT
jgi:6-phosphofructokinase 1